MLLSYLLLLLAMGRKAKFDGTQVPTGHGKKVKKQSDPTFPQGVLGNTAIY